MQIVSNQFSPLTTSINTNAIKKENEPLLNKSSFGNYLQDAIKEMNHLQIQSDEATSMLAEGKRIDLHQVMIAGQKASISMQAALEIRNKAVEAYQEIMRMQV